MQFLGKLISSTFLAGFNALLSTVGKTVTDVHTSNTARQQSENAEGGKAVASAIAGHGEAARTRADVQKSQGTWGPFGLAAAVIAGAIAFHVVMIILDSTSWHLAPTLKWYVLPWLEWRPHVPGSWNIKALPGKFEETEHEILRALFYVGPPSAALALLARAFRR